MSNEPEQRPDDSLREQVETLAVNLLAATKLFEKASENYSTRQEVQKAKEDTRAEVQRDRRRAVIGVLISTLIAMAAMVGFNNYAVTRCFFVSPPRADGMCDFLFHGYNSQVKTTLEQIQTNADTIKKNRARLDQVERDVADLKAAKRASGK